MQQLEVEDKEASKGGKGEKVEELLREFEGAFSSDSCTYTAEQLERLATLFRDLFHNAKREGNHFMQAITHPDRGSKD
jgi:hypothetical protein